MWWYRINQHQSAASGPGSTLLLFHLPLNPLPACGCQEMRSWKWLHVWPESWGRSTQHGPEEGEVYPHTPCLCGVYNQRRTGGDPRGSKVKLFGPVQTYFFLKPPLSLRVHSDLTLPLMLPEHSTLLSLIWALITCSLCCRSAISLQCRFPGLPTRRPGFISFKCQIFQSS